MHLNFLVHIIQHTLTFHGLFYYVHMYVDKEAVVLEKFTAADVLPVFTVSSLTH